MLTVLRLRQPLRHVRPFRSRRVVELSTQGLWVPPRGIGVKILAVAADMETDIFFPHLSKSFRHGHMQLLLLVAFLLLRLCFKHKQRVR